LLGEAKGDPLPYSELNARLEAFAQELGVAVKVVQSNCEGTLIDALQAERKWAEAILINPGALTHTSYALRECLRIVNRPTIEVHLEDIRRRETWRRHSVMKDVCEAQVMGKGLASYLDGLERLATGKYGGLRRGRAKAAAAEKHAPAPVPGRRWPEASSVAPKTLGRSIPSAEPARLLREAAQASAPRQPIKVLGRSPTPPAEEPPKRPARMIKGAICRALVRDRIAARLGKKLTPGGLASWAREQWLNVERGAATEMGQRELLEEALQSLALSATPTGKMTENELVELMTRLE
jgi:3-dehydroquinate dehydratase-2